MTDQPLRLNARTQEAVEELQRTIGERYPTATFAVTRAADDPGSIHLIATVDTDDPDEVGDLVLDRVVELQVDERIPVHVIPIRAPERVRAERPTTPDTGRRHLAHRVPLFEKLPAARR